jgi:5'-methylthioadenosine phosphorylase
MRNNINFAKKTVGLAAGRVPAKRECECASALGPALVTDMSTVPEEQKQKLDLLIGKYIRK